MTTRQQQLLKLLVDTYIETAEPVSSQFLALNCEFQVSSATIRNDLSALEQNGYVKAPHTSSGRIPTPKGYRFYIEWFVDKDAGATNDQRLRLSRAPSRDVRVRRLAQALSELTGSVVVLSPSPEQSYATGFSRLLAKPEFHDQELVMRLGAMLDAREKWLQKMYGREDAEVRVAIDEESPFGKDMASMTVSYHTKQGGRGVINLIGPSRMNYEHNMALLRQMQRLIDQI